MEGAGGNPPPATTTTRRHTTSLLLNSDTFITFLLMISLCFIFLVLIPPFFKPHSNSIKKSWDFLSLVLVFFAIACGFLSKTKDQISVHEETHRPLTASFQDHISNPSTPHQWHGCQDQTNHNLLPLHHPPSDVAGNANWRISGSRYSTSDPLQHCQNMEDFDIKTQRATNEGNSFSVYLDGIHSFPPRPTAVMRPSTPPRVFERKIENFEIPSPPFLDFPAPEYKINQNKKKRRADGKEFSSSLKRRRKKKKLRKKNIEIENSNNFLGLEKYHFPTSEPITSEATAAETDIQNGSFSYKFQGTPFSSKPHNVNSIGKEPPLRPLSPPYTTAELKMVMHGDYYVRKKREMKSSNSEDKESYKKGPMMMFCPSPDVNSKADSFIERFRAGLKLEKMNSMKERQQKRISFLGQKQNPVP